ncbi:MAG: Trm112 family protein [Anaerolineae bacterium]
MRKMFTFFFRIAFLAGVAVGAAKLLEQYRGSPEGVGDEGFSFGADEDPFAIDESTLGGDVSQDLLDRLVCPLDKGPLILIDGKWLVNPRNGYRYPITDGIPVMLVEVGEKYKDESLIGKDAVALAESAADAAADDASIADVEGEAEDTDAG